MKEGRQGNGVARTVGAFALGATAGSVLALLFAPASGQVTRKRIALKVRQLQKATDGLRQTAATKINVARTWVMNHIPNGHAKRPARRRAVHA